MEYPKLALAANRSIGVRALDVLLACGWKPAALLVAAGRIAQNAEELCGRLPGVPVLRGKAFREAEGVATLSELRLDYLLSVHFPYIVPAQVLSIPRIGTLNLHPAYLPYNRGWHTPSWAIHDKTPYGATLHWMDEGIDTGPVALQRQLDVRPEDTADTLYQRVLQLEESLLQEAIPLMANRQLPCREQSGAGTEHRKDDLKAIQWISVEETVCVGDLLDRMRALSTSDRAEALRFSIGDRTFDITVDIRPVPEA